MGMKTRARLLAAAVPLIAMAGCGLHHEGRQPGKPVGAAAGFGGCQEGLRTLTPGEGLVRKAD